MGIYFDSIVCEDCVVHCRIQDVYCDTVFEILEVYCKCTDTSIHSLTRTFKTFSVEIRTKIWRNSFFGTKSWGWRT